MAKLRGIAIVAVYLLIVYLIVGTLEMSFLEIFLTVVGSGMLLGELFEDYLEWIN